jgi:hypothetical protein
MENNKYIVTINGTDYVCDTATMYNGGEWGYLRFWLGNTGFEPKFAATYSVQWRVEAKDGSWAYTCESPLSIECFKGVTPPADAVSEEDLAAIYTYDDLNDKVNRDSVATNVGTYNDTTETVKSVFDDDLTNKMGSGDSNVTITWSTTEAITVTDYVVYSGNDVKNNSSRNPVVWTLSGSNDGETWTVIDTVKYSGIADVVSTDYGYNVDNPGSYTNYKMELKSQGGFELGELILFNNPDFKPVCPHTNTELKGAKEATETEKGYTGDKVCTDCGETVEKGKDIPATGTNTPAPTGDSVVALVVLAVVSLLGMAVISKKRA